MQNIPIREIRIEHRLRAINQEHVEQLAKSIADVGLLQPIVVRKNGTGYVLVAGAHRLEAAKCINWSAIDATVLGIDGLEAELAEIDENLMRNELSVLERGEHLAKRKEIYEGLHPETKQGMRNGQTSKTEMISVLEKQSFATDTASKTGLTDRTIRQEVQIANAIAPDVKERIRGSELADTKTQLIALAQMDHAEQRRVVSQIESGKRESVTQESPKPNRTQFTGDNEWYTPKEFIEAARAALGSIDLDPASTETANRVVGAKRIFTIEDDALLQKWKGKIWLNPPYAQPAIGDFVKKLVDEIEAGRVEEAIMLTHNYTDTAWFHLAESKAKAICFTRGRIRFYNANGELASPTQGQAFFYYGNHPNRFAEAFKDIGFIR